MGEKEAKELVRQYYSLIDLPSEKANTLALRCAKTSIEYTLKYADKRSLPFLELVKDNLYKL